MTEWRDPGKTEGGIEGGVGAVGKFVGFILLPVEVLFLVALFAFYSHALAGVAAWAWNLL